MIFKSATVFADAAKYVDNFHVVDTQSEQRTEREESAD